MAVKRPLVLNGGQIAQLQAGDTITMGSPTIVTPARVFGAAFQVSTTRDAFVTYSARIVTSSTITGGAIGRVELVSDAVNPPTTVRARITGGSQVLLGVGITVADTFEAALTFYVPAGWFVLIRTVNEVGTPTFTLTAQTEELM